MATPLTTPPEEFQKITQELYKKNLELVNANKELALLQKLYETITKTFTVEEVAQKFIAIIVKDLGFLAGSVALKDRTKPQLLAVAATHTPLYARVFKLIGSPLPQLHVTLHHSQNLLVKAYRSRKRLTTDKMYPLLTPLVDEKTAEKIGKIVQVKSTIVYPLVFGRKPLGVFTISLNRPSQDLTQFEKTVLARVAIIFGVAIDRISLYQDLRVANKRLRELDRLKDEFLSIAGHELRTPMTAIKSYVWMILNKKQEGDNFTDKTKHYLDRAYESTERLIALVNDMLDVSRIESGRIELKPEALQLIELANEVKEEVAARAAEGQLTVTVQPTDGLPAVWADKNKIHQVLLNFVGNSIKFTPAGGQITISFKKTDHMIETAITDNGKGIAAKDLSRLFTKFGRLEGELTSIAATKGTGLGLFICKQLVELQGGKVWAASLGENQGTTFTFSLPVAK